MTYVALYYLAGAVMMALATLDSAEWMTSRDGRGSPVYKFILVYAYAAWLWPVFLWHVARWGRL
jgi:hypothetical protein